MLRLQKPPNQRLRLLLRAPLRALLVPDLTAEVFLGKEAGAAGDSADAEGDVAMTASRS